MTFTVRPAAPSDAPALLSLCAAFNGDTGATLADVHRSLLTSAEIVLLAEVDGAPAGFCCAQVHHSFCYPAPVAEVTEMYVAPEYRRKGCAGGMLRSLEELLSAQGVDELHLLTGMGNHAAQAAYRKAGFREHAEMYMSKPI